MTTLTDNEQITKKVRSALEQQGVNESELAQHLGISPGGMSKAFSRNSLLKHIDAIAAFLEVPAHALTGDRQPPDAGVKQTEKPQQPDLKLTGGCLLARITVESVGLFAARGRWATLAAPLTPPDIGCVIAYEAAEGGWHLRRYERDATNTNVVLTGAQTPEVFPLGKAPAMRVVLAIGDRLRGAR